MKLAWLADWKSAFLGLARESLDSPAKAASSAALGVFFGIAPFWGFQLVLSLLAASLFKVNRVIAGAASNISAPPLIPFIVYASLKTGELALGRSGSPEIFLGTSSLQAVKSCAAQYLVGSVLLAFLCALAAWGLVYISVLVFAVKNADLRNKL